MTNALALLGLLAAPVSDNPATFLLDRVIGALKRAVDDDPDMRRDRLWESLGDACLLRGLAGSGEARTTHLARAVWVYTRLTRQLGTPRFGEDDYRRLWKYAGAMALLNPPGLERFFQAVTRRGYAPGWDSDAGGVSRWGYRDRLEALRPSAGR